MSKTAKRHKEKNSFVNLDTNELPRYFYNGALKRAINIAEFYGFHLIPPIEPERQDRVLVRGYRLPDEKVALTRIYLENRMDRWKQHPIMLAYTKRVPNKRALRLTLEILGTPASTAEALLLQTANVILREHGFKNTCVNINSIGNNEAMSEFAKELSSYYKKHLDVLDARGKSLFRHNVFELINLDDEKSGALKEDAPKPISFLNQNCRRHFAEILEYLETLSIPYQIDGLLIGDPNYSYRTVFEIRNYNNEEFDNKQSMVLARGERYDNLSQKAGFRKKIPAAHVSIELPSTRVSETIREHRIKKRRPKVFLVQLGTEARHRALSVAETLRKSQISTRILLGTEGLSLQLTEAHRAGASFVAIIGQKEVAEGTIIVRSLETRSQDTVSLEELSSYLKNV